MQVSLLTVSSINHNALQSQVLLGFLVGEKDCGGGEGETKSLPDVETEAAV